jgi:molybdopterin-guanine dinucleotide biosynthesis protein A
MLSAFERVRYKYAFVIACDSPLIHKDLVEHLYFKALSYSAAIPVWDETDPMTCEPLCGVYEVEEMKHKITQAVRSGTMGCKRAVSILQDVRYVPVSELKVFDPMLNSLLNVNSIWDYKEISHRCQLLFVKVKNAKSE